MSGSTNGTSSGGHSYKSCKEVSLSCPVQATVLGYYPNLGVNAFLAAGFALCVIVTAYFGIRKKTWSYSSFVTAGCILELAGYIGRVQLSKNPWNSSAFQTQICAIILAPTLICISIYLTLKHVCLTLNPALSRVRPRFYPLIFVPADVSCLLVQAIGGSLAAAAGYNNPDLLQAGDRAIIAGIALQVVVLAAFGLMSVDYFLRVKKWIHSGGATPEALELWNDRRFRTFIYAVTGAYSGIMIRCIYRIAEMAGGWGNRIMQDEPSFIVLEGFMILIPVVLLACFPPGVLFPQMAARKGQKKPKSKSKKNAKKEEAAGGDSSEGDVVASPNHHHGEESSGIHEEKDASSRV